jgi:hypothetical protein
MPNGALNNSDGFAVNKHLFKVITKNMKKALCCKLILFGMIIGKLAFAQDTDAVKYKTYINSSQHYSISFPENWYMKLHTGTEPQTPGKYAFMSIDNMKEKVVPAGSSGEPTKNGTAFQINSSVDTTSKDIKDRFKGLKIGAKAISSRLKDIREMTIDNHELKVWNPKGPTNCSVEFVCNGRYYSLQFMSGSEDQFAKDYPVFKEMLRSFKFVR